MPTNPGCSLALRRQCPGGKRCPIGCHEGLQAWLHVVLHMLRARQAANEPNRGEQPHIAHAFYTHSR